MSTETIQQTRAACILAVIEKAMAPYVNVLPAPGLAILRDLLEDTLATHPVALEALAEMEQAGELAITSTEQRPRFEDAAPPAKTGEGAA